MGSLTTNLKLYKPDAKENGWAEKVNDSLDLLDKLLAWNIHNIVGDDAILPTDALVSFNRTAGSIAASLPPQAACILGKPMFLKVKADGQGDDGSKLVTLTPEDGALIDGISMLQFSMENESKIIVPNGIGWDIY